MTDTPTDTPATPETKTQYEVEHDALPWFAADQLEADLEDLEHSAYEAMSGAITAVRDLPGMSNRGVDIEDPVYGPARVMLRLSPYDYLYNHLREADVLLHVELDETTDQTTSETTSEQLGQVGDLGTGAGWSLTAHSGKPITIAAAAWALSVPRDSLGQAISVLVPGMRAALALWREQSPSLLAEAQRYAREPRSAGDRMDTLVDRIRSTAYAPPAQLETRPTSQNRADAERPGGEVVDLAAHVERNQP